MTFDRATQDVGNVVEFGHVNLRVPDQQQALLFYVTGLGLTRDPYLVTGVDNAWINAGASQFHLPVGPAQVLRGSVGLVMVDLDALCARLDRVAPRLRGTRFAFEPGSAQVDVTCPWGNRLRVHAPDEARFGPLLLGMPYVQIDVPAGTADGIARFYAAIFAARTACGEDADGVFVRVTAGPDGSLVFRETRRSLPPYDGHHLQIALADFSSPHRRLRERGLVTEESNASQYRFQDVVDPADGKVLVTLEHEVRSMRHPLYGRSLVNRDPAITAQTYTAGREAAMLRPAPRT
jgi:catechol 2,3-dioxygenase-like lactoylglutathione lyase family enzyme